MDVFWANFPGCECLKRILLDCGFDNEFSISIINNDAINLIEAHLNENREIVQNLGGCHKQFYEKQTRIALLPAHTLTLSKLPEFIKSKSNELKNNHPAFSSVLSAMVNTASKNYQKHPNAHRYPKLLHDFAMYTYLTSGKASYKMICRNLPLPRESTIINEMQVDKNVPIEGQLRCNELRQYLIDNKSDMNVFLSEDGSGIVKRVTYDPKTQQLVGIVLPLKENGMPKTMCFVPRSAEEIQNFMKLEQSKLVYIVVAQPLTPNIPPFIVQAFGTNNKFKKADVLARWTQIEKETKRCGINVIGLSSDGDTRLLSSMRSKVKLSLVNFSDDELNNYVAQGPPWIFAQDTIHEGTKMRNRLLKPGILLPMGNRLVSIAHLKILLKTVPKKFHMLVRSDICPLDRQNYDSLEKMMKKIVIDALEEKVIGSEATVMFLRLCKQVTASYLDEKMTPIDRIYNMWHAVYFLRAWRKWISSAGNSYRLNDNFITSNAYQCIEINAHSLIFAILKLRSEDKKHLFQTNLFSSQPCESTFRQLRALGTQNFTKINFCMHEFLHMVSRIELMNKISSANDGTILFPQRKILTSTFGLPNNPEILSTVEQAKKDALENAKKFDMVFRPSDIEFCEIRQLNENDNIAEDDFNDGDDTDEEDDINQARDDDSRFIQIASEDGSMEEIRKSKLVQLLTVSKETLSNDRLKRVQGAPENNNKCKRKKVDHSEIPEIDSMLIEIGEWCMFNKNDSKNDDSLISKNPFENVVFGAVMDFKYPIEESTEESAESAQGNKKPKKYNSDFAVKTDKKLSVLASWYDCNSSGVLSTVKPESAFFISISNFIATTGTPKVEINPETNLQIIAFRENFKEIEKKIVQMSPSPSSPPETNSV